MRKKIILGNWKMNNNLANIKEFANNCKSLSTKIDAGIAVPSIYLHEAAKLFQGNNFIISAENVYFENNGAYTGEISTDMLNDINVKWTILGHSERRQLFNETDLIVNKKVIKCLNSNINVVLCVGETLKEYESNQTEKVISTQLKIALTGCNNLLSNNAEIVIAYEPIWAIGTGKVATVEYAEKISSHIRKVLANILSNDLAEKIRIQYGGSVKPENIKSFLSQPNIDGALVGGASLVWESFYKLIKEGDC